MSWINEPKTNMELTNARGTCRTFCIIQFN